MIALSHIGQGGVGIAPLHRPWQRGSRPRQRLALSSAARTLATGKGEAFAILDRTQIDLSRGHIDRSRTHQWVQMLRPYPRISSYLIEVSAAHHSVSRRTSSRSPVPTIAYLVVPHRGLRCPSQRISSCPRRHQRRTSPRTQRAGAASVYSIERTAALCQILRACDHWILGSTQVLLSVTDCAHAKCAASADRTCVQIFSCSFEPITWNASSYIGSLARAMLCTCATIVAASSSSAKALNVTQPDSGWPCGVISVNDSSSA